VEFGAKKVEFGAKKWNLEQKIKIILKTYKYFIILFHNRDTLLWKKIKITMTVTRSLNL
jgi:hypothetical protein